MSFPGVNIEVSNDNLLQEVGVLDGVPCLCATATQPVNIHALKSVYSLSDAESKGFTEASEPFLHDLIETYYNELGGKQLLYIYGTAETETMADELTYTNNLGVLAAVNGSRGSINLIAIARKPVAGYNAGANFLDTDVESAVIASRTLCKSLQNANTPVRVFIEGRVANETAPIAPVY